MTNIERRHSADHQVVDDKMDMKADVAHVDYYDAEKASTQELEEKVDIDHGYDPAFIKATIRKIDYRLIPPLIAMYCISSIDRKNVSLARAANNEAMQTELNLGTNRYNIITLLFFPPYILFELPVRYGVIHTLTVVTTGSTPLWSKVLARRRNVPMGYRYHRSRLFQHLGSHGRHACLARHV